MEAERLLVYVIQPAKEGEKEYWNRCGVAWVNKDGSINMQLDLLSGTKFQLRKPATPDRR